MNRLLPTLLLVLLAAPGALAHFDPYSQAANLRIGDYGLLLNVEPANLYAGKPFAWVALVGMATTAQPVEGADVSLRITDGPAEVGRSFLLAPSGSAGQLRAMATLPSPGLYNVTVRLSVEGKNGSANASFQAYRDLGAEIVPENPALDVFVNRSVDVPFLTVRNGQPVDAFPDLAIRLERWTDDHRTRLGVEEPTLLRDGTGRFLLRHTFSRTGMYHLYFCSQAASFCWGDTPLLHVYATESFDFGAKPRDTGLPVWLVGATVVAAALAAGAFLVARRR